jgi:hypothetical protein
MAVDELIMNPSSMDSLIDDGRDCWMTVLEAAAYADTEPGAVVRALISEGLVGMSGARLPASD